MTSSRSPERGVPSPGRGLEESPPRCSTLPRRLPPTQPVTLTRLHGLEAREPRPEFKGYKNGQSERVFAAELQDRGQRCGGESAEINASHGNYLDFYYGITILSMSPE